MRTEGLPPFIPADPRVLILGSMPSVKSLEQKFYYAHPRNRFWPLMRRLSGLELADVPEKQAFLHRAGILLTDMVKSCERKGSLDSAVHDPQIRDVTALLQEYPQLGLVITNGALSRRLFLRHIDPGACRAQVLHLPSTSPANAAVSLEQLAELYLPPLRLWCRHSQ